MNKPVNLLLLVLILVVGIVNLLASCGLFGGGSGGGGNHQYRVVTWQQMDSEGFKVVAEEIGAKPDEAGKMQLPKEKVVKSELLPRSLKMIEDEGWEFIAVTADNHYIFRK